MNYDDKWFWDEWEHEVPNDPMSTGTKVFIIAAVHAAFALIVWAVFFADLGM